MTTINANQESLGATVNLGSGLLYEEDTSTGVQPQSVTVQAISGGGQRLGGISYNIDNIYRPAPKPLTDLPSSGLSGLLLEVGASKTTFGYKGSNLTNDGDIAIFYDSNKNYIKAEFSPPGVKGPDDRFHFSGSFTITSNVKYILFGGRFSSFEIEEITLA